MTIFETLNGLNVNEHTEKKKTGGTELTYLSWPWAWAEVKKRYPGAHYEIWRNANGVPYAYDPMTGYMVYTTVTIGDESHDMWLPVMDGANNAMKAEPYDYQVKNPKFRYAKWDAAKNGYFDSYGNKQDEFITKHVDAATMFDINKTIMRCLVKNLAMFGLGLYIYAGEDLPDGDAPQGSTEAAQEAGQKKLEALNAQQAQMKEAAQDVAPVTCTRCGKPISGWARKDRTFTASEVVDNAIRLFGAAYCYPCCQTLSKMRDVQEAANG